MKRIAILTSSRADFGIYLPLLKLLKTDRDIQIEVIAFGTHLSEQHGYTVKEIKNYNFPIIHELQTPCANASPRDISMNISSTISIFSDFWSNNQFSYVVCLGDRYEMMASILALSPFNAKIAHIHGGETTLGAIDNMYRHTISLMSSIVFVTNNIYRTKSKKINPEARVYNVGALSIDNLTLQEFYTLEEFSNLFSIDLAKPSILITFHPETVGIEQNEFYISELINTLEELKNKYQIIITLPNADTMGDLIRNRILHYGNSRPEVKVVESFGMKGYLSCMKYCSFMLGNSSSGFVEAAFFPKWVINLGDRQKGRILTKNILSSKIDKETILEKVKYIEKNSIEGFNSIYGNGGASKKIIRILKKNI